MIEYEKNTLERRSLSEVKNSTIYSKNILKRL